MNRDLFNERNVNDRYGNAEDNDNDNYTFKRSYVIPSSYNVMQSFKDFVITKYLLPSLNSI